MTLDRQQSKRIESSVVKRVVVVDDSTSIRRWLCHVISTDPRLIVVGEAADAFEARNVIKQTNPDVITLDIQMPGMSGLEFLERLIRLRPMPVVMVSSLTDRGSDTAVRALSVGAVDCLVKPSKVLDKAGLRKLTRRIYAAACSTVSGPAVSAQLQLDAHIPDRQVSKDIILIGASTGGVAALEMVIGGLDPRGPPVVIVQHMPGPFLVSFARRLNDVMPQDVRLLEPDAPLYCGQVWLAPGVDQHSIFDPRLDNWKVRQMPKSSQDLHCPSVDALFQSAVRRACHVTAVILTGLGKDGAAGLKALKDAGAHTIGQDQNSSVVYGMPRAAMESGAVTQQLPLRDIAAAINTNVSRAPYLQSKSS